MLSLGQYGTIKEWAGVQRMGSVGDDRRRRRLPCRHAQKGDGDAGYRQLELDRPAAYEMAQRVMVEDLLAEDAQEGITAFLEKREPKWNN